MKIVAGLGSADDYLPYCDAGADECFCGYIPESWMARYGMVLPLNRREVRYYPVQIGARSELQLLGKRAADRGIPVTITLNALYYLPEQYPIIADLISQCIQDGFTSFIIADPALLIYLNTQGLNRQIRIHLSGELGEFNQGVLAMNAHWQARRLIFHRKVSLNEMAQMTAFAKANPDGLLTEFEAFALNECCHFHGGFCCSLHCDELTHLCKVPYRIGGVDHPISVSPSAVADPPDVIGASGCGLCALPRLRQAGVTHLKLVGRGNLPERMVQDIAALKAAVSLADTVEDATQYQAEMKKMLFPLGCSNNCYYRE